MQAVDRVRPGWHPGIVCVKAGAEALIFVEGVYDDARRSQVAYDGKAFLQFEFAHWRWWVFRQDWTTRPPATTATDGRGIVKPGSCRKVRCVEVFVDDDDA